jgi:hypothetical protein
MVYTPFKTNYLQEQPHNYQHPEGVPIQFGAQHPVHPATQPLPIHPHMPQPGPVQGYTPPKNAPLPIHPADMAAAKKQPHLQPPINAGPPPGQGPGHMPQGPMGMVPPHYPPHMRPQGMNPVPPTINTDSIRCQRHSCPQLTSIRLSWAIPRSLITQCNRKLACLPCPYPVLLLTTLLLDPRVGAHLFYVSITNIAQSLHHRRK